MTKKTLAWFGALFIAGAFAACGGGSKKAETTPPPPAEQPAMMDGGMGATGTAPTSMSGNPCSSGGAATASGNPCSAPK